MRRVKRDKGSRTQVVTGIGSGAELLEPRRLFAYASMIQDVNGTTDMLAFSSINIEQI
jgi:hypothetical protein